MRGENDKAGQNITVQEQGLGEKLCKMSQMTQYGKRGSVKQSGKTSQRGRFVTIQVKRDLLSRQHYVHPRRGVYVNLWTFPLNSKR